MYLRPTPATVDPSVPGSTRRPQISVRPGVTRETTRGNPPPPKRSLDAHERSERTSSARASERVLRRERPPEPKTTQTPSAPTARPPASRPRTAMVVSPVSLTQEEVQPGARPKMPTLLGLGAAMDVPQSHGEAPSSERPSWAGGDTVPPSAPGVSTRGAAGTAERVGSDPAAAGPLGVSLPGASSSGQRHSGRRPGSSNGGAGRVERHEARGAATGAGIVNGFEALALQASPAAPDDIGASAQLLADFALKLSLGPISRSWLPDVRRSVDALLLTGKHRNETALVALSTRLLEVLPGETPEPDAGAAGTNPVPPLGGAPDLGKSAVPEIEVTGGVDAISSAASDISSVVDSAVVDAAVVDAAVVDAAVVDSPGDETHAADTSVAESSAAETSPAETSPAETPAAGSSGAETSAAEAAAVAPSMEPPASLEPSTVDPSADPAAVAPSTGEPGRASHSNNAPQGDATAGAAEAAPSASDPTAIDGVMRDRILHEVSRLAGVLPEWPAPAQDLTEEARRRETQVMRQLLAEVDGLKRDQRARLEEQMRLEELANMSPETIAEEFGAPLERASDLRRVLDGYREERLRRAPDVSNASGLRLALAELDRQCQAFDDCDPERKDALRVLRAHRRQALSAVNLLLAERGELDWLEQLEPLAIGERVERLKLWLDTGSERAC